MRAPGPTSRFRQYFLVVCRCGAVAVAIAGTIAESLLWRVVRRPDRPHPYALHRWSRWLMRRFGIEAAIEGSPPHRGLIVSNHLSYLDILVFSSIVPCSFISKQEVKWWPGVGWAASLSGAIFVDRARASSTRRLQPRMARALSSGATLVLFPEGTSGDGATVMPFHSSLLQAAVDVGSPITAASLAYEIKEGDARTEVCYWGDMSLVPHALKLFAKTGITVRVRFGGTRVFTDRKQAAAELWEEVNALFSARTLVAASPD